VLDVTAWRQLGLRFSLLSLCTMPHKHRLPAVTVSTTPT